MSQTQCCPDCRYGEGIWVAGQTALRIGQTTPICKRFRGSGRPACSKSAGCRGAVHVFTLKLYRDARWRIRILRLREWRPASADRCSQQNHPRRTRRARRPAPPECRSVRPSRSTLPLPLRREALSIKPPARVPLRRHRTMRHRCRVRTR